MDYWKGRATAVIAAYGATTLPPIPPDDEGPKALDDAYNRCFGYREQLWAENDEELNNARRAQWAEAVRLLRGVETGKGGAA